MQLEIGILDLEGGELLFRFLDAVLAEHALAGFQHLADHVGAMGLGNGDQGHGGGIATGGARGGGDAPMDLGQAVGAGAHVSRLVRAASASALLGSAASAASRVSRALSRWPSTARQAP